MSITPGIPVWFSDVPKHGGHFDSSKMDERKLGGRNRLRILVVDDEVVIADTLVEILIQEGFEAKAVSNGDAALEIVPVFEPDIVVTDVVMPGSDGVQTGIRVREILPKCRVILFSGQSATVDLLKNAQQRGHEFEIVAKPIKPQDLIALIRRPNRQ